MKKVIEVTTGEVKSGADDSVIVASAVGSCIAVVAYDARLRRGGIAHIMLPGSCPAHRGDEALRYAENAFRKLLELMSGSDASSLILCLAGAGNVLKRADDTVCRNNMESVLGILDREGFTVAAASLGGTDRRRISLDVESGTVTCATGNGPDLVIWKPER